MNSTLYFKNSPVIASTATVGGPKEGEGPLGKYIDKVGEDDMFGEDTFEKAERFMLSSVVLSAMRKSGLNESDVDALVMGDLLNQIISSSFSARRFDIPFLGVYNACSTMAEAMIISALLIDGGYAENVVAATASHFSSAERQYRYPLELGSVRPPQSQWTVTGAGACVVAKNRQGLPFISSATIGRVVDFGVVDTNNMGAAMAPAASDTICRHLTGTGSTADDYDMILTGDLGALGSRLTKKLCKDKGFSIDEKHVDCGELIFNMDESEFQGGSGAGCGAVVFNSYIYEKMKRKQLNRVLFVATGALLSTLSQQQGESIPSIAHAVCVENQGEKND